MSNFWNKDGLVVDVIKTSNGIKFITEDDVKSGVGHSVGEQWISFDGTIPEGGLPFDGQLRNVELYQQLFNWAKENGRVIDEEEWQHLRETNNGNVPYYSFGDGRSAAAPSVSFIPVADSDTISHNDYIIVSPSGEVIYEGDLLSEVEGFFGGYSWSIKQENGIVTITGQLGIAQNDYTIIESYNDSSSPSMLPPRFYHTMAGGSDAIESTTFRLPIFNSYFKADVVGGGYVAEGLPNIVGNIYRAPADYAKWEYDGVFEITNDGDGCDRGGGGGKPKMKNINFDASRYSAIYGNSEHVTPETSTVIVGVWAVGSYTNVTNIDMSDIKEAINVASTLDALPLLSYHWDYKRDGNAGWVKADGYWLSGNLYKDAYEMLLEMSSNSISPTGIDYGMKFKSATYTTSLDKSNPYDFLIDTTAVAFRLPILSRADRLIVYQSSSQIINGGSTPRTVTETWYSDGTVEIDGTYDAGSSTSGTINWITSLKVPYNLILQDTRHDGTETDVEGWGNIAGPSAYTANSFRVSHFKGTGRIIDFHIKGEPTIIDVPKYRMMYFKLGNTFINEEQMDAANISNKIDRVWDSWQEADYVVESYSNGTEWYRLYKSGWLEQGGEVYHNVKETHTVNLLVPYRDTYYNVTKSLGVDGIYTDSSYTQNVTVYNYTTTSFDTRSAAQVGLNRFRWRACGYSDILN